MPIGIVRVGNVFDNDYTWTCDNPTVATVSLYGFVVASNPGVTNVFATLNGTMSAPLSFVTCPPAHRAGLLRVHQYGLRLRLSPRPTWTL